MFYLYVKLVAVDSPIAAVCIGKGRTDTACRKQAKVFRETMDRKIYRDCFYIKGANGTTYPINF